MASLGFIIEHQTWPVVELLQRIRFEWPPGKLQQFSDEWDALEDAGAQMIEVEIIGQKIIATPSHDFLSHLKKWCLEP
ncbi:MAG: hypothetical protein COZ09_10140 [Comamonadaceae bacterium CG_4_10_14_3_um_filter_60_42]|nr:MAG: hypothetical protein COZ09_10140 [Comamonadaceae bacterium CG_4_10_14_3_um_filter_60_42]